MELVKIINKCRLKLDLIALHGGGDDKQMIISQEQNIKVFNKIDLF